MGDLGFRLVIAAAAIWACAHAGAGDSLAQAPARDVQSQESAVRAAEQHRQRAADERARAQESYRQARTDSARAMKSITDRIQALEEQRKKTQALPDGPQKVEALRRIDAEEKRILAEGEKVRAVASAAQKNRADATVNLQKAQAAEKAAKEQLAHMRTGQSAGPPAQAAAPALARPVSMPAGAPPQALVNARIDVEAAEKALATATAARQRTEAANKDDSKELTRQLSLVAEQRKRIEAIEDKTKREALLKQSAALEARIKGELQQSTAPVVTAQKAEADARVRLDHAVAAEKRLRATAGQSGAAR